MPNLFPEDGFTIDNVSSDEQAAHGGSWMFDFEKGDFVREPTNRVAETDAFTAWVQWCQKVLMTQRYRHLAYSSDYGSEFEDLIGMPYTKAAIESEIQRMATEALMVHSYTQAVDNFTFEWTADYVNFTFQLTSIMGENAHLTYSLEGVI
jgi:phage baseplate assembly protein W